MRQEEKETLRGTDFSRYIYLALWSLWLNRPMWPRKLDHVIFLQKKRAFPAGLDAEAWFPGGYNELNHSSHISHFSTRRDVTLTPHPMPSPGASLLSEG